MQRPAAPPDGRLAGPRPLLYKAPSKVGVWLSLVEPGVGDAGVAGPNPATPTNSFPAGIAPGAWRGFLLRKRPRRTRGGARPQAVRERLAPTRAAWANAGLP